MVKRLFFLLAIIVTNLAATASANAYTKTIPELFTEVARNKKLPEGLLYAIALTETGTTTKSGRVVAWPWTMNYKKKGYFFRTRSELYEAAKLLISRNERNFDICVMQINWYYHSERFDSLYDATEPETCINAASDYLLEISRMPNRKSWSGIVGGYHNFNRSVGNSYANKVKSKCALIGQSCYSP